MAFGRAVRQGGPVSIASASCKHPVFASLLVQDANVKHDLYSNTTLEAKLEGEKRISAD